VHGEDDDLERRPALPELGENIQSASLGHRNVEQDAVDRHVLEEADQLIPDAAMPPMSWCG
jgi:hypothetical protein